MRLAGALARPVLPGGPGAGVITRKRTKPANPRPAVLAFPGDRRQVIDRRAAGIVAHLARALGPRLCVADVNAAHQIATGERDDWDAGGMGLMPRFDR